MTLNFCLSFPSLWSSFFSCLKPPYIVLVLIITIIALSRCYPSIDDGPDENTLNCGYQTPLPWLEVKEHVDLNFTVTNPSPVAEVEMSNVVYEEKGGEILEQINSGYERVMLKDLRNLSPSETPLVSARSGHRKLLKVTPKGKRKKAVRVVVEPKRHDTLDACKMIHDEGPSTPLTSYYQRPNTFGLGPDSDVKHSLRKSKTSSDGVTNTYHRCRTVAPIVEKKKQVNHDEQDLEFDEFIKKTKKQMKLEEQDVEFDEFINKTKNRMRHEVQDLEFAAFLTKMENRMRQSTTRIGANRDDRFGH